MKNKIAFHFRAVPKPLRIFLNFPLDLCVSVVTKKNMINTHVVRLITCLGVFLLLACFPVLKGQVYADLYLGLHPRLVDDGGTSAHVNFAIGRQISPSVGYGLNFGSMSVITVSTTSSFSTLGLQYRWLENTNRRVFAKAELGNLLRANYTTDSQLSYRYQSAFNLYFKTYLGYRIGRFVLGCNYTRITPFSERIYTYDEMLREYLPTNDYRMRDLHDFQLYLGIMLDNFKPIKKRR